jgi:hypothetical protein
MALPKVETPIYTLKLPSSGQEVKYRPFIMKEEKALLFAYQSEEEQVLHDTLKAVVTACTFETIDVEQCPMFDLEYIFVQLRVRSVGALAKLMSKCDVCEYATEFEVDLEKVNVNKRDDHTNDIRLFGDVGMVMKYPSFQVFQRIREINLNDPEEILKLIIDHIDHIYDKDTKYPADEQTKEELMDFIGNLTQSQMNLMKAFFDTIPRLQYKTVHICGKCQTPKDIKLEGLKSFFS